jgi:hypothetical protein
MLTTVEDIFQAAELLDRRSQYELAERLMEKLGESPEHHALWAAESRRRSEAYEKGEIGASDAAEVFSRVRRLIGK